MSSWMIHSMNMIAEEQDDRRNVDAAGVGQEIADRPQERLGQGEEQVPDRADDVVADVDDAEGDQPGQDRAGDDDDLVEIEDREDEFDQRKHAVS